MLEMELKTQKIGIVGSGLIGRAWSMLFASAGYRVMLYDILPKQIENALIEIEKELKALSDKGALRGQLNWTDQLNCISITSDIKVLVENAIHIQECIPERIELKRALYYQLDSIIAEYTIIASSTSTFMPSFFSAGMQHKANVLVAHPLNPPYFIPLVEIVPAAWTHATAIAKTAALMRQIGQKPVTLRREIAGFATNRIQYAILNEVWRLVADGVLSVADVDSVMADGLGLRYALLGPLETAHLNANGVADYFARFGGEIHAVSQTYGATPRMAAGAVLQQITRECEQMVPPERLAARRELRNEFLRELAALKRQLECVDKSYVG